MTKWKSTSISKWKAIGNAAFIVCFFIVLIITIILIQKKFGEEKNTITNTTEIPSTTVKNFERVPRSLDGIVITSTLSSVENENKKDLNENSVVTNFTQNKLKDTKKLSEIASQILINMDQSINPCDDFYRFACGGFVDKFAKDKEIAYTSTDSLIFEKNRSNLKFILEEPSLLNEPKLFKLAKNYYKTCMNKTAIEEQGLEPLKKIINQLGGWPVVDGDKWNQSQFNWIDATLKLENMGYPVKYFLNLGFNTAYANTSKRLIYLTHSSNEVSIPNEDFFSFIATKLGANHSLIAFQYNKTKDFAHKLAQIPDCTKVHFKTISELMTTYPHISWKNYLNGLLSLSPSIDENEWVGGSNDDDINDLENLLNNTEKWIIANYMIWMAIKDSLQYLNDDIRDKFENPRICGCYECVDEVSKSMPIILSALFIRKYFNEDAKKNADEIAKNIHNQFIKIVANVSWMDEKTKKYALEKAKFMLYTIGYPDELSDDSKLEEYYKGLEFSDESYLEQHLKLSGFNRNKYFGLFKKLVYRKLDWQLITSSPIEVNAFYDPSKNRIEIPAGHLQDLFFNTRYPKYMNYGIIGTSIGHEITHGFDTNGRHYGKDGALVDSEKFLENENYTAISQCFIEQFAFYKAKNIYSTMDTNKTLDENIADSGIKIAYSAYLDWLKKNGEEEKLPNINWSSKQMFWISAANYFCSMYTPEEMEININTDEHSPDELRVLGSFSNMPEFAEDFNCPIGSRMNPVKKCSFW